MGVRREILDEEFAVAPLFSIGVDPEAREELLVFEKEVRLAEGKFDGSVAPTTFWVQDVGFLSRGVDKDSNLARSVDVVDKGREGRYGISVWRGCRDGDACD